MQHGMRTATVVVLGALATPACGQQHASSPSTQASTITRASAFWNGATVYFLLTDRFANGNPANDHALDRPQDGAVLRSFMGGDLAGVLGKLQEGYFDSLGVTAIWMTPFEEQIRGSVDEGTGKTYGYHGYWTRDWTAVEPALGTKDDLRAVVDEAHRRGIRVLMDAVINHTGPVTPEDPPWPSDWVRTSPRCTYESYVTTVDCTLVDNLPDIRMEQDSAVALPAWLTEKWKKEGRWDQETAGLDAFFARTGYPRAPRYYVMKWLTDWVREFGFDGYRMDTAKHFEESVAVQLKQQADSAFADWKRAHPDKVIDDLPFYMVGEVSQWSPSQGRTYDFGDRKVDYFAHGYDGLINFGFPRDAAPPTDGLLTRGFPTDAAAPMDALYARYSAALNEGALRGVDILNYLDSHDDAAPYDRGRKAPLGDGTLLLLAPGGAQIYYGDELARPLQIAGAKGDANLRSFMNWDDLKSPRTSAILEHWRKLARFRRAHPAVGAGEHHRLQAKPYIFSRILEAGGLSDRVLVAMGAGEGAKTIPVFGVFPDGAALIDSYSGVTGTVANDRITLTTPFGLVLLGERR
jgi:alpha-amylase